MTLNVRGLIAALAVIAWLGPSAAGMPPPMPDLKIQKLRVIGPEDASLKVEITVKNIGWEEAAPFRTDVYKTSPERSQLLFTLCPLTRAQQAAGGSAPCGSPFTVDPLPRQGSITYTAWITWPADAPRGVRDRVVFMADGCFPALEPDLPAHCRVEEGSEANNTRSLFLRVP